MHGSNGVMCSQRCASMDMFCYLTELEMKPEPDLTHLNAGRAQ